MDTGQTIVAIAGILIPVAGLVVIVGLIANAIARVKVARYNSLRRPEQEAGQAKSNETV